MPLVLRVISKWSNFVWLYGAVAILLAWVLGQVCSDRWWWSQWLLWIPGPLVCLINLVGAVWHVAPRHGSQRFLRRLLALGAMLAAGFSLRDGIGWSCAAPGGDTVSIAYLNARWPGQSAREFTPALARVDADLFVVGNCGRLGEAPEADRWVPADALLYRVGPFAVASGIPLAGSRLVYAGELGTVAVIQTVPLPAWPNGIRIGLFDLPSDPLLARSQLARRLQADLLAVGIGELDVAVGDFNMTFGWSLQHLLPGMESGSTCGWQGTFPRQLPLWRPDHILVRPPRQLHHSTSFDPAVAGHRGIRGHLSPAAD